MNNDNYYLIIGSTFLKEDFDYAEKKYYKKNVMISNAIFEHKLLKGFEGVEGKVIFISTPIVGRYPFTSKRLFVKGFHSDETIQSVNYCCLYGFINYFKRKAIIRRLKKYLKRYLKMHISISLLLKFINHI